MKKQSLAFGFFLALLVAPIMGQALFNDYVPGSLIKDKISGQKTCIVEEGFYFLVIDNTGVITGDFDRNNSYVVFFLSFSEADIDTIEGSGTVDEDNYFVLSFNFNLTSIYVTECTIEIYASNRVSIFLVDYLGLAEYYDEVGSIDINIKRQLIWTIVGVGSFLAVGIAAATFFILRKIRRQESIIKELMSGKVRKEDDEKQRNVA